MKRIIFVLFVLCNCISFFVTRTVAQEEGFKNGDNNIDRTAATILIEGNYEDARGLKTEISEAVFEMQSDIPVDLESYEKVLEAAISLSTNETEKQNETKSETSQREMVAPSLNNLKVLLQRESDNGISFQNGKDMAGSEFKVSLSKVSLTEFETPVLQTKDEEEVNTTATDESLEVTTIGTDSIPTEVPALSEDTTDKPEELLENNDDQPTTQATNPKDSPRCTTSRTFADENDCHSYFTCSTGATTNELQIFPKSCPSEQAFQRELLRCTRDLSPCADAFKCEIEGTFADHTDNSSYFWCVTSRFNITGRSAYHIYHVKCGNGQIFTPELGKCFVDMMNLQDLPLNYELYMSKSPDEECVREEVKVLQAEEKAKLKEAKLREKIRKKYEKELRKKAAKEAKEQAKLQGVSLEGDTFNCVQEGIFAAAPESFFDYFVCFGDKGKFKATGLKCAQGQNFSAAKGVCTL